MLAFKMLEMWNPLGMAQQTYSFQAIMSFFFKNNSLIKMELHYIIWLTARWIGKYNTK